MRTTLATAAAAFDTGPHIEFARTFGRRQRGVYIADQGGMPTAERRMVVFNRGRFIADMLTHVAEATPTSTWGHAFSSVGWVGRLPNVCVKTKGHDCSETRCKH